VRWTENFRALAAWGSPPELARRVARLETLAVARFETVFWENTAVSLLDLTFHDGVDVALLAGIAIDTVKLAQNEGTACFWAPATIAAHGAALLDEFEAAVTPWLRTLVRGRVASGESIRRYAPCAAFEAARAREDLGAAPIGRVLAGVAPFAYARRFAAGAVVEIRSAHAARGAAVLRTVAATVAFRDSAEACAWFGVVPGATAGPVDLAVVESPGDAPAEAARIVVRSAADVPGMPWRLLPIPEPVPMDWPLTFDEADAPAVGFFAARAADRVLRPRRSAGRPRAAADSAGRIAILLRPDAFVAADADLDEARELALLLESIGIEARLFVSDRDVLAFGPDLVHVFAAHADERWAGAAARLHALGVPYVVSLEPLADNPVWEERALTFMSNVIDGDDRERFRSFFKRRALTLPPGEPDPVASDEYLRRTAAETTELLRAAAAVFTTDDAQTLRARFGLPPELTVCAPGLLLAPEPDEEDPAALLPSGPFVFAHGPIVPSHHALSLADALAGTDVPLVLAGPVSDVLYAARIARTALDGIIVLGDPAPGLVAALYRRATVFVDPALRPVSALRAARAALCGALPAVPSSSPLTGVLGPHALTYDSLDRDRIRAALAAALADPAAAAVAAAKVAAELAPRADLGRTFGALLAVYAQTASAPIS
jgi:hypothetical protein